MQPTEKVELSVTLIAITPDPEKVIEQAGRTCYLSFQNMNATSSGDFVQRMIKAGHESTLEHAYATFRIQNCSRAMTHQLVRHRLMAISQQSQRYVSDKAFTYVTPPTIPPEHLDQYHQDMQTIQKMYEKWLQLGLKREDARFVLPNACTSEIVISANFREFRHIFKLRTAKKAQWEIRNAATKMLETLRQHAPNVFFDIPAPQ